MPTMVSDRSVFDAWYARLTRVGKCGGCAKDEKESPTHARHAVRMDDVRPLVRSSTRHELDEAPAPSLQVIDTVKHDEPNPVTVATDKVALVTGTRLPVVWSIGRLPCDCVGDSIVRRGLALVLGKMLLKCADIRSPQRAFTRHGPC